MPDLNDEELLLVTRAAERITARRRTVLYRQGDRDSSIYYLIGGRVRVSRSAPGPRTTTCAARPTSTWRCEAENGFGR